MRHLTPETVGRPLARYSHAVEVEAGSRLLFLSGQLAVAKDGSVPEGVAAQAELIFRNCLEILAAAGMTARDLVRVSTFLTRAEDLKPYMAVRDRYVADPPPASTLLLIQGFSRPEFKIEVEMVAAKG
ncbi:MAG: RidA family protein [Alphaproteobacteria bacterium]|nr:RidA family protein [Alphaproteobacteria bacterium]